MASCTSTVRIRALKGFTNLSTVGNVTPPETLSLIGETYEHFDREYKWSEHPLSIFLPFFLFPSGVRTSAGSTEWEIVSKVFVSDS